MATKKTTNAGEVQTIEKIEKGVPFNYTVTPETQEAVIILEQAVNVAQQRGVYTINDASEIAKALRNLDGIKNFDFGKTKVK